MSSANIFDENKARWTDADGSVFINALTNLSALAAGDWVLLDAANTSATVDAVKVSTTTAGEMAVGVAIETIASGAYGTIQVYGHNTTVKVDGTTTSVAVGDNLQTGVIANKAAKFEAVTVKPSNGGGPVGVCLATVASGSDTTFAVFIDPR